MECRPTHYILLNISLARINKNYFYSSKRFIVMKYLLNVIELRMQLVNLSTASLVALNKRGTREGSKRVLTALLACKIDTS